MTGKNSIDRSVEAKIDGTYLLSTWRLFREDEEDRLVAEPACRGSNAPAGERRTAQRQEWRRDAICRPVTPEGIGREMNARTCNISAGGVAVLLEDHVEPGTYLDLTPLGDVGGGPLPLVHVMHIVSRGAVWVVGCAWLANLRRDHLDAVLGIRRAELKDGSAQQPLGFMDRLWQKFHGRRAA